MSQNMNSEFSGKLKRACEVLRADVIDNVKKGIDNTVEMTKATGSDKFVKSGESLEAGTKELLKAAEELVEVLEKVAKQYDAVNAALS